MNGAPPAAGGGAHLASSYLSAESVDQGPQPETGWAIDESVLPAVPRVRLLVRLWVSSQGHIDRLTLLQAEPAGAWADRAMESLAETQMIPAQRGEEPVAASTVVEIIADLETLR